MTTAELERLLEATAERPDLDFKGDCPWVTASFTKDILAMANLQDGGRIVIGVADATLARTGVSETNLKTFDIDQMRDQVRPYADPHVNFHLHKVQDASGLWFAVITVDPFEEVPVLCRKDGSSLTAGCIYYRPSHGRVQSAPVSTSSDMRNILLVANARMTRRHRALGLSLIEPSASARELYERELADFAAPAVVDKITARGHYRVSFRPTSYRSERLTSLAACREAVETSSVNKRGFSFPNVHDRSSFAPGATHYECELDNDALPEVWQMYQSGQFRDYVGFRDDWGIAEHAAPGTRLNIHDSVTREFAEIFEFLSRLSRTGIFDDGVDVSISAHGLAGRRLTVSRPDGELRGEYIATVRDVVWERSCDMRTVRDDVVDLAASASRYIFERFGWSRPEPRVVETRIVEHLERGDRDF